MAVRAGKRARQLNATLSKNDKRQSCRRADRATIDIVEEEATDVRVHYSGIDLRPCLGAVGVQNRDTAQQGVVADGHACTSALGVLVLG